MSATLYMEVADIHECLAHPLRLMIIDLLSKRGRMSWSDLEAELSRRLGERVNPNTLNFHLTKLIRRGFVVKDEVDSYSLAPLEPPAREILEQTLRRLKAGGEG